MYIPNIVTETFLVEGTVNILWTLHVYFPALLCFDEFMCKKLVMIVAFAAWYTEEEIELGDTTESSLIHWMIGAGILEATHRKVIEEPIGTATLPDIWSITGIATQEVKVKALVLQ